MGVDFSREVATRVSQDDGSTRHASTNVGGCPLGGTPLVHSVDAHVGNTERVCERVDSVNNVAHDRNIPDTNSPGNNDGSPTKIRRTGGSPIGALVLPPAGSMFVPCEAEIIGGCSSPTPPLPPPLPLLLLPRGLAPAPATGGDATTVIGVPLRKNHEVLGASQAPPPGMMKEGLPSPGATTTTTPAAGLAAPPPMSAHDRTTATVVSTAGTPSSSAAALSITPTQALGAVGGFAGPVACAASAPAPLLPPPTAAPPPFPDLQKSSTLSSVSLSASRAGETPPSTSAGPGRPRGGEAVRGDVAPRCGGAATATQRQQSKSPGWCSDPSDVFQYRRPSSAPLVLVGHA